MRADTPEQRTSLPQRRELPNYVIGLTSGVAIVPALSLTYFYISGAQAWWLRSHALLAWYVSTLIWVSGTLIGWIFWVIGVVSMFAFIKLTHRYYRQ